MLSGDKLRIQYIYILPSKESNTNSPKYVNVICYVINLNFSQDAILTLFRPNQRHSPIAYGLFHRLINI